MLYNKTILGPMHKKTGKQYICMQEKYFTCLFLLKLVFSNHVLMRRLSPERLDAISRTQVPIQVGFEQCTYQVEIHSNVALTGIEWFTDALMWSLFQAITSGHRSHACHIYDTYVTRRFATKCRYNLCELWIRAFRRLWNI